MRRCIFLLALVSWLCPRLCAAPPSWVDQVKNGRSSVFALVILDEDPLGKRPPALSQKGTAFLAPQGIVTCAHVVEAIPAKHFFPVSQLGILVPSEKVAQAARAAGKTRLEVLDRHEFVALKLVTMDPISDLALLKPEGELQGINPLPLGDVRPPLGTEILILGHGDDAVSLRVCAGIVSGHATVEPVADRSLDLAQTAMLCPVGFSGAPVLERTSGKLIGIATDHHRLLGRTLEAVPGLPSANLCVPVVLPVAALESLK